MVGETNIAHPLDTGIWMCNNTCIKEAELVRYRISNILTWAYHTIVLTQHPLWYTYEIHTERRIIVIAADGGLSTTISVSRTGHGTIYEAKSLGY